MNRQQLPDFSQSNGATHKVHLHLLFPFTSFSFQCLSLETIRNFIHPLFLNLMLLPTIHLISSWSASLLVVKHLLPFLHSPLVLIESFWLFCNRQAVMSSHVHLPFFLPGAKRKKRINFCSQKCTQECRAGEEREIKWLKRLYEMMMPSNEWMLLNET